MDGQNRKSYAEQSLVRWPQLNLTGEQAEKISKYESQLGFHNFGNHLSAWENWDCEFFAFNDILDKNQLALYLEERGRILKDHEANLVEEDNSDDIQKEIEFQKAEISYLENEFLPAIFKYPPVYFMMHPNKTKYDFLKAEYKSYLDAKKKEIIANHFRHSRTFQPNTLKKKLLRHKIEAMYPDFSEFKNKMDEATKATANYLKVELSILNYGNKSITSAVVALYAFRTKASDNYEEYVRSERGGFYAFEHIEDKRSEEEKNNDLYFSLLLIDRDYYGNK